MARFSRFVPFIIIAVVAMAVYYNIFGNSFLINWDDTEYVTNNPDIRGFSPDNIRAVFTSYYGGNYAPIQMLSYMLDYSIWGLDPRGFLLTNLILQAVNSSLLYILLRRYFGTSANLSLLAALIFLCHPVQVESVAWVSQRKNLLSATLFLTAIIAYINYVTRPAERNLSYGSYGISIALFTLSILTKSVTIILLPLILLFDICHISQRNIRIMLLDKIPYVFISLIAAVLTLLSQNPYSGGGITATYHGESGSATAFTMMTVLPRYFRLIFFPRELSPVYDVPIRNSLVDAQVIGSLILILALLAFGFRLFKTQRKLFFWYGFFFIALLPVSQIVPIVTLMNDRYLYFPLMGFCGFLAGSIMQLPQHRFNQTVRSSLPLLAVGGIICLGILSHIQTRIWHDSLALWEKSVQINPESSSAWTGLATSYHAHNKSTAALQAYLKAVSLNPANRIALNNLTLMFLSLGKQDKAEQYALHLIRTNPDYALGFSTLGTCYLSRGEVDLAVLSDNKALSLQPDLAAAWNLKGDIALLRKNFDEAIGDYEKGYSLNKNGADTYYYSLAAVAAARGNVKAALDFLRSAYQHGLAKSPEELLNNPYLTKLSDNEEFRGVISDGYAKNRNNPLIFK